MRKKLSALILVPFLLLYAFPAGAAEKEERKWQDEVIYSIMVDRFLNGDTNNDFKVNVDDPMAYNGGDFIGIQDKLEYLQNMGFTAIMLSPVFDNEANGYHGYWINDFYKTEEHFGTLKEFKALVNEAHKRKMKVILDFPVNHVGPKHPWLADPKKKDWFHERKAITGKLAGSSNVKKDEMEKAWIDDLPDLAQENPETGNYLIEAGKWWINETDVDGYRLDAVNHVPMDFWTDFAKAVKSEKEDFYLLGETSGLDAPDIAAYQNTGIDGFLDFQLNEELRSFFGKPSQQELEGLVVSGETNRKTYQHPELMGTFLDDQDMPRFTREAALNNQHPGTRWKLALSYLYTTPGIPIVYYGTEIAMNGNEVPENRALMAFKTEKELIDYITKLGELRQQLPALTRGDIEWLHDQEGMAVYKRSYKDETIIVVINNSTKTQSVSLGKNIVSSNQELRGLLAGDLVRANDDKFSIITDRDEVEIYAVAEKSGLNIPYLIVMGLVYTLFVIYIVFLWKRSKRRKQKN
ncbi:alpha-amlyase [Bacillus sp. M6-12]|uniref:alpha-amylase family glycosyl hydrolase n=1 Tax=Bacillus sp. M6-12 TaxID=2054166 RepID=UPI000C75D20E|nr:alpha-amylase family glycosyl hydrolase [Bacillus sp. M6-12]PLS15500.1 alpha-amlyase [Bacillus sp. M6-12]